MKTGMGYKEAPVALKADQLAPKSRITGEEQLVSSLLESTMLASSSVKGRCRLASRRTSSGRAHKARFKDART